jgi:hypothetical protein
MITDHVAKEKLPLMVSMLESGFALDDHSDH